MKRIARTILAIAALMIPSTVLGGDVDDLKAAYEEYIEIINAREDPQAMVDAQHADFQVNTTGGNPFFAVRNRKLTVERQRRQWTNFESFTAIPYQTQYKVVGDTGLVWGHRRVRGQMRGGRTRDNLE